MTCREQLAAALALGGVLLWAQRTSTISAQTPSTQAPTFKLRVEYVEVDAVVTDKQGDVVRGLTKDDFRVFEDGKPQAVSSLSFVDLPAPAPGRPSTAVVSVAPDVASNAKPFDGRLYVVVIDDLHTLPDQMLRIKAAAKRFVQEDFGATDLMAVIHTLGSQNINQAFTSDRRLLLAAIDRTTGRSVGSATVNTRDANQVGPGAGSKIGESPELFDDEQATDARAALDTIQTVADRFASVRNRRKALLFFSEGLDYNIHNLVPNAAALAWVELQPGAEVNPNRHANLVLDALRRTIDAAMRNNVAIYGIDPRGLTNNGADQLISEQNPGSIAGEVEVSQDSLRTLSEPSGGFAVVSQNDFATAYRRIAAETGSYYVLAYYPQTEKRDGKFHKIDVRVDRPGVTVRARHGYLAPKGRPTTMADDDGTVEIRDALSSPIPVSGLTLDVFAAPFTNPIVTLGGAQDASVLLGVELRGRDLQLGEGDRIELAYLAIDANGKTQGAHTENITLNLEPRTRARAEQTGVRFLGHMNLAPGRYQLHVAARDKVGGKVGSAAQAPPPLGSHRVP